MYELFDDYWWLLFPLAFFLIFAWNSFMRYKQTKAKIELLKTYAASGNEPPAELIRRLDGDSDDWSGSDSSAENSGGSNAFLVILFTGLAGVFVVEARYDILGMGEVAYFVAMIMGVLAFAFLVGAIFQRGSK
ncbi:hypothetical protein [Maricaulis sp.]|uniref:hypothetical protein n=1 Tax=Maricaulis sp. TaxID=1486257 RepID=UPI00261819E4|nr:hypothetical protein [Maricaulis sp.]